MPLVKPCYTAMLHRQALTSMCHFLKRAQGRWALFLQVATWQPRVAPLLLQTLHLISRPRRTATPRSMNW